MSDLLAAFDAETRAEQGIELLCGVDEAGRGPLAGPVCCAAVILPPELVLPEVNDSKKLTEKKRELLFDVIREKALAWSVVMMDNCDIDRLNILQATMEGMKKAVSHLSPAPQYVLVDGNKLPDLSFSGRAVVGGDAKSQSVAAASILAKVSRDRLMIQYDSTYPQYGFAKHKGYPTKQHYQAIEEHGVTEIHRKTFLKGIV